MTEDPLAAAYSRCFPVIAAKCRRMLGSESEALDIAQETFIRLWQTVPHLLERPDELGAWIYRASTRLAVDRLRRQRVREAYSPPQSEESHNLEARIAAQQRLARIAGACSSEELSAAVLNRLDGLDQREIAGVLGVSERTVRRLLQRFDVHAAEDLSS
ncbi:MAG: RNA polymerase sigma factor [Myxococcaceae bacterium]